MSLPPNTLLVEGSFSELADELAQYIDNLRKNEGPSLHAEVAPALEKLRAKEQSEDESGEPADQQVLKERDEVLKKIVVAAPVLNNAPEKEITAAYNLLIHLTRQSSSMEMFLPRICAYLSKPIPSSPTHGPSLALSILSTIFNTLAPSDDIRFHVFLGILAVIRSAASPGAANIAFDALKEQLERQMQGWIESWELDEEDTLKLHNAVVETAQAAGDAELAYKHLIEGLRAIPPSEASAQEHHELAVRALTTALTSPLVFDFTPLTASDAIQNLRSTDTSLFELLEIFASDTLDSYEEFISSTPLENISKDLANASKTLETKMRLLTLASLAASTPSRSLPYASISSALRVPASEVEKWVIDTIRAGLVEGKLSQLKSEFLVHRATYRVFGEKQWLEVQGRLMVWRRSLENVLGVVRTEREKFVREGIAAAQAAAERSEGGGRNGERRRGGADGAGGQPQQQQQQQPREVDFVGGGD